MGASASRAGASEGDGAAAGRYGELDEDGGPVCAICISSLTRATPFSLPDCGHCFHALCLASALQVSPLCPICRLAVPERVCTNIAAKVLADPSQGGGSMLAAELLLELRARGRTVDSEPSAEDTAGAVRRAARQGDTSKIPSIAALLGRGEAGNAKAANANARQQPPQVRLAAAEALRALVPAFPGTWPGLQPVLQLLRGLCVEDDCDEVRCAAMQALKEVGQRGNEADIQALQRVLEDPAASGDLRVLAGDALQALAVPGDARSLRAALLAFRDEDCSVRSSGLSTLKSIAPPRGECPELLQELGGLAAQHRDPEVRASALELVAQVEATGGARGIAIAAAALRDASEPVPQAALAALRRLWPSGDPRAVATLGGLLAPGKARAEDPYLRCSALDALAHVARRGDAAALAVAAGALDDEDSGVRGAAVQAVKQLCLRGDEQVTATLLAFTGHADAEVQRLAVELLGHVASASDNRATARLRKLQMGEDTDLQLAAEQALRQLR